jgi:hypothetical protein
MGYFGERSEHMLVFTDYMKRIREKVKLLGPIYTMRRCGWFCGAPSVHLMLLMFASESGLSLTDTQKSTSYMTLLI